MKAQAETVLSVQVAVRLKLAELTAVPKIQVKVLKLHAWLLHEFYFKCFFKWVGGVLALTTLSDCKLADLLSAPVPPHRAVGGILYIPPISGALPSAAAWTVFVYCLTIAIKETYLERNRRKQRHLLVPLNLNSMVYWYTELFLQIIQEGISWCPNGI